MDGGPVFIYGLYVLFMGAVLGFVVFCTACFFVINETTLLRKLHYVIPGVILLFCLVCAPQIHHAFSSAPAYISSKWGIESFVVPFAIFGKLIGSILGYIVGKKIFKNTDKG